MPESRTRTAGEHSSPLLPCKALNLTNLPCCKRTRNAWLGDCEAVARPYRAALLLLRQVTLVQYRRTFCRQPALSSLLGASQAASSALFGNKNPRRYLRKGYLSKQYKLTAKTCPACKTRFTSCPRSPIFTQSIARLPDKQRISAVLPSDTICPKALLVTQG